MVLTNKTPEKKIKEIFSRVAPHYDEMNRLISLGVQRKWRQQFLENVNSKQDELLDLCCGTGASTILLAPKAKRVVGLDFNQDMLKLAKRKINGAYLQNRIHLVQGDAMHLPFGNETFNGATICFGLRNVPDAGQVLTEIKRVLKRGGQLVILEMSQPTNKIVRVGWKLYFKIFPYFAKFTKNRVQDYQYLARSSRVFLTAKQLARLMKEKGFAKIEIKKLTFGAGAIHVGYKK